MAKKKFPFSLAPFPNSPPWQKAAPPSPALEIITDTVLIQTISHSYQFYLLNNSPILLCIQKKFKTFDLPYKKQ